MPQPGHWAAQVLTPYLGQLLALRKELQASAGKPLVASLHEADLAALRAAGGLKEGGDGDRGPAGPASGPSAPGSAAASIRCSTIDNFQVEEADVVIVSLVRCNGEGSIGFLAEPERVTVMLSRARHGMIPLGSASTLRAAKNAAGRETWNRVLGQFEAAGGLALGLTTVCPRHPRRAPLIVTEPGGFANYCPHGGCTLPCEETLPCGHPCPLPCHPAEHSRVHCGEMVVRRCETGLHFVLRPCGGGAPGLPQQARAQSAGGEPCSVCLHVAGERAKQAEESRLLAAGDAKRLEALAMAQARQSEKKMLFVSSCR